MNRNPSEQDLKQQILKDAEQIPVPASLEPEAIRKKLEEQAQNAPLPDNSVRRQIKALRRRRALRRLMPAAAAAACFALAVGIWNAGGFHGEGPAGQPPQTAAAYEAAMADGSALEAAEEETAEQLPLAAASYDEIYQAIHQVQERRFAQSGGYDGLAQKEEMVMEAAGADGASSKNSAARLNDEGGYSTTNLQEAGVDEADTVKNDGQYLYQLIRDNKGRQSISIVRADGSDLEEVSRIPQLENVFGFYLNGDQLIVIEHLWLQPAGDGSATPLDNTVKSSGEDVAYFGTIRPVTNLVFYDITDRSQPKEASRLSIDGNCLDSRISGGYLYLYCQYTLRQEADPDDPRSFIPVVNGELLTPDSVLVPENSDTDTYLLVASVKLDEPTEFTDSVAVLSTASQFYVSEQTIYVADSGYQLKESYNTTNLTAISYQEGKITGQKSGTVKGLLLDDFAMNEYNGYLRLVTTVTEYEVTEVYDDLSGEFLGYSYRNETETNSLYVLDQELTVVGKIEGLAEDERIYSARFMGDIGYFVTFEQVDPLFSVDLSEPASPKIIGELKITGFSEYLHFYDENLLLGIGQEVDPDTMRTVGVKLSMFDISDPSDVKEIHKLVLEDLSSSDVFYDYKAALVDPEKNLIGFPCQGEIDGIYQEQYMTFSYDAEKGFTQGIHWINQSDYYWLTRGAYIGHVFYVLQENGAITAYHLANSQKIGSLEPSGS